MARVTKPDGQTIPAWCAFDANILKAMSLVLADFLPVSKRCVHAKGHGGAKAAVRFVRENLGANTYVMRTEVTSCYARIDYHQMHDGLARSIRCKRVLILLCKSCLARSPRVVFSTTSNAASHADVRSAPCSARSTCACSTRPCTVRLSNKCATSMTSSYWQRPAGSCACAQDNQSTLRAFRARTTPRQDFYRAQ